jgi:4-amino-4-deoxy-L-arabinose transferase-like glycosyltransferase
MFTLKFVAWHYLALGLLAALAYLFGRHLTRRFEYQTWLEATCFSLALGLGVLAYLTLALGLIGQLYRPVLVCLLGAGCLLCAPTWIGWSRQLSAVSTKLKRAVLEQSPPMWCLVLALAALAVPFFLLPLYPPIQYDAAGYHLPYAKIYVAQHRMVLTPYLRFPVSPQTNQMLFTLALLLDDDVLAHLIEFLMMVTVMAAVVAFGGRFLSPRAGWWAAASMVANPVLLYTGTCALIDMGVTLFTMMTLYALWIWHQRRRTEWFVLSAVFCGLAIGTKLTALFVLGFCGLVIIFFALRERQTAWPFIFVAVALLVAAPWFARSFYYTGNPIYPLMHGTVGKLFPTRYWKPQYNVPYLDSLGYYLNAQSLGGLLRLPWRLSFETPIKYSSAGFFQLYFFIIPQLLIYGLRNARVRWLLVFTAAYLLFWFFTVQDIRYLVLVLPALSLASAEALNQVFRQLSRATRWLGSPIATAIGVGLLAMPGLTYAATRLRGEGRFPVTQKQRDDYLTRVVPTYPAFQLVNRLRGRDYKLYGLFNPHMAYYADGQFVGDYTGEWAYSRLLKGNSQPPQMLDGPELYRRLRGLAVDYLLIDKQLIAPGLMHDVKLPDDDFFAEHFKVIFTRPDLMLFELTEEPAHRELGPDLLVNPGFEMLEQTMPVGWTAGDHPVVDDSGEQSHGGRVAVEVEGTANIFSQQVALPSPGIYSLRFFARAPHPGQSARLWVDWQDGQQRAIRSDVQAVKVASAWTAYEMFATSPALAAYANVYVIGEGPGFVWFDDFLFAKMEYR